MVASIEAWTSPDSLYEPVASVRSDPETVLVAEALWPGRKVRLGAKAHVDLAERGQNKLV